MLAVCIYIHIAESHNNITSIYVHNTYRFEFKVLIVSTKIKNAKNMARATKKITALILPAIAPTSADSELWPLSSVDCSKLGLVNTLCSLRGQSGA